MTTIAYKTGIMACDSRHTAAGRVFSRKTKIHRSPYAVFGAAGSGDSRTFEAMLMECQAPERLPSSQELLELEIDQEALIVFNNGQIFGVYAGKKPMSCWVDEICGLGFAAVGSGAPYALAAMEWGASAYQAVVTACAFDPNSASPFYTLELNHPLEGVQTC